MTPTMIPVAPGATVSGGGVTNFMSWQRLEQALRQTGEVRPNERIEKVEVSDHGLQIYYQNRV